MPGYRTDDTRIEQGDELLAPMQIMRELKASEAALRTTYLARTRIHDVLRGADDRLVVVVGPCSIHDATAAETNNFGALRCEEGDRHDTLHCPLWNVARCACSCNCQLRSSLPTATAAARDQVRPRATIWLLRRR